MRKRRRAESLKQRWLVTIITPVAFVLVAVVLLFSAGIVSYYYQSISANLTEKAMAAAEWMNNSNVSSYSEYYRVAADLTRTDGDKDKLELQFINSGGRIQASSYGITTGTSPRTSDISIAMESGKPWVFQGRDPVTGEHIIAVSAPLTFNGHTVGVMRYVTSLDKVNRQVMVDTGVACLAGLAAMGLVLVVSLFFINSVIKPVVSVSEAAKRIAAGSYGIQVENRYEGELGELVQNVNEMSLKISQSEKMEQEFISSVSHELRTPLTAINGWVETMEQDVEEGIDPEELRRGLGIIQKETNRLTNMVEELLDFSRMQDGRFTLRLQPIDLQAEFEDTVYTYRSLFRQEGIELNYDSGEIEECPIIEGDPERLRQVFCNVLDNAAKHGGSGRRIDAAFELQSDAMVITIRDYGPGIPEAELPFVKQKFYKGSSKARGSGIGLAVCDEIMRLQGGEFTIANAEGGGAVCELRFPTARDYL
ncbi:MAG: HAMP domain-containing histidine kinase [Oscillospiraceae bacterium]|nr:HAMP domain-containing histidine kinase [Oscillospiraceae bacterium]